MLSLAWHWIANWIIGWGGVGALVTIAAWLLWYFTPSVLSGSKSLILHIAVGATIFTASSTYFFTSGISKGYALAINQVAAKNKEATDAVNNAISIVESCDAAGGTWDTVTGLCVR